MDPDRWRRVQAIFHDALERDQDARAAWLDDACRDDPALRAEVESLLSSHQRAGGFLSPLPPEPDAAVTRDPASGSLPGEGRRIGPYVLLREIGRGGMGVIYLARDTRLGRDVALKTLPSAFRLDPRRLERLKIEARAAAGLSHPAIASVFALEELDGTLWLVYEYVPGPTLRQAIEASGPVGEGTLLEVAAQLADALAAAHGRGVVHRDLKPENVILTADGRVKVLDFGLARLLTPSADPRLTTDGMVVGTPAYMAPEQLRGEAADFAADLFAFGIILAELASGVHPLAARDGEVGGSLQRIPQGFHPTVRAGLERVIARCLQPDPRQRYARTADLVADLQRVRERRAGPGEASGLWWWRFHQVSVSGAYASTLYPAWLVRAAVPSAAGTPLFFFLLVVVVTAVTLRLHLWFTSRLDAGGIEDQRRRLVLPVRVIDWATALLLFGLGQFSADAHPAIATALVIVAVASFVSSVLIEPATARAAFPAPPRAAPPSSLGSAL